MYYTDHFYDQDPQPTRVQEEEIEQYWSMKGWESELQKKQPEFEYRQGDQRKF